MKQYSKRTAILHWLIFLLVVALSFSDIIWPTVQIPAEKLSLLPVHFLTGDLILILVLVRIYFRKKDGEPAPANANPLLNKIATATHGLLNLSLIAVADRWNCHCCNLRSDRSTEERRSESAAGL